MDNNYKYANLEEMGTDVIQEIVTKNSFSSDDPDILKGEIDLYIQGFVSFINHSKNINVMHCGVEPL